MEKIVIVSSHPDKTSHLVTLLQLVFPECEIHAVSNSTEAPAHPGKMD